MAELYTRRGLKGEVEALGLAESKETKRKPPIALFTDLNSEEFFELVKGRSVHSVSEGGGGDPGGRRRGFLLRDHSRKPRIATVIATKGMRTSGVHSA